MLQITRSPARVAAFLASMSLVLATLGSSASAAPSSLQAAFTSAAAEFGVPANVLLGVSYTLTRWEAPGAPGGAGAFGPLQLADSPNAAFVNARGDESIRTLPTSAGPTVAAAAAASGATASDVRANVKQNIRGGAALLAQYARDTVGSLPRDPARWYGAVAKYSGSTDAATALGFADSVFAMMAAGASRTTSDGQTIVLTSTVVTPDRSTATTLGLRARRDSVADCPPGLDCRFIPAAYQQNNPADPTDYGNYDLARRPTDGLDVRFIVIHDAETSYDSTIRIFQNSLNYVSAHYVLRSSDGQVTQMVENRNVAWHAGNWNFNMHAIGYEHEGVAIQGATWYTDAMYRASAALTRYLAARYHIPLDRAHIIGHDDVPGPSTGFVRGMHWDPGPFWDWARYMKLLGAPIDSTGQSNVEQHGSAGEGADIVTIAPRFESNRPQVRDCQGNGNLVPPQPANFVYLRTAPSSNAPLFNDPGLATGGTDCANDWGDKAVTGQTFYRAERQGDWDAIYYAGSKVWFYDPAGRSVADSSGKLITPKTGSTSIPVYGRAYPESISTSTMAQYSIPAGQRYVAYEKVKGDYYDAPTFNDLPSYHVVTTETEFYLIRFNHRLAYVKASDVDVIGN
jgi:N-acetyl-anhydromuramyl-L-alanine amidase AmpD